MIGSTADDVGNRRIPWKNIKRSFAVCGDPAVKVLG